jgi:hypothetical protein
MNCYQAASCALISAAALALPTAFGPESAVSSSLSEKLEILRHMSIVYLDNGQGGVVKTIRITGVNVQIVNGLGATNGYPAFPDSTNALETEVDGTGNLIVGYNEFSNPNGDDRTGSHNLIVGHGHSYSSFGCLVAGQDNTASGVYASVSGGWQNVASGARSSVAGGVSNRATTNTSAVSGGDQNTASGNNATVSGGQLNVAVGDISWAAGGVNNRAEGDRSVVLAGAFNMATGTMAAVTGGDSNRASGFRSVVSGGLARSATGASDWVAGSLFEDQ